jgi:hypothetical protein
MKQNLILLIGLLLLVLAACDRFDHEFTAPQAVDVDAEFFAPLATAFTAVSNSGVDAIRAFYAEEFMHNGVDKSERLAWIDSFLGGGEISFVISDTQSSTFDNNNGVVNWRLQIIGPDAKAVLADSLFSGEKIRREGEGWVLEGNKVCTGPQSKQLVIAEYFTFDTCPNCPPSEAKLHQLQTQYPNFIYLEHHIANSLLVPGNDTSGYYSAYSAPSAVFQGAAKVIGSSAAALADYESIVGSLVTVDEPISYELSNITHNAQQISATVHISPNISIDMTDVHLSYLIITDEVTQTNINGDPLHNVVRAVGRTALAGQNLEQGIPISLQMTNGLPSNYKLVVFAQYRPQTYVNNATIYGGIVHSVSAR